MKLRPFLFGGILSCILFFGSAELRSPARAQTWDTRGEPSLYLASLVIQKAMIESMLQTFVSDQDGKSFRHLGFREDFFHGHLLYTDDLAPDEKGYLRPFAVLYHTQEDAFSFHQKDPGGKFDYLSPHQRSWVQFLDRDTAPELSPQNKIQNAYRFMPDFFPNTLDFRASLDATRTRFTVSADQLDSRKFPASYRLNIVGQRQVEFDRVDCATAVEPPFYFFDLGIIRILQPISGETVCLSVSSPSGYIPVPSLTKGALTLENDAVPEEFRGNQSQ